MCLVFGATGMRKRGERRSCHDDRRYPVVAGGHCQKCQSWDVILNHSTKKCSLLEHLECELVVCLMSFVLFYDEGNLLSKLGNFFLN